VEESPGSTETRCRLTAGGGDPRESATENKPPASARLRARVKRCGKSAPRFRQRRRQGKPHREQDRIGAAGGTSRREPLGVTQGCFRPVARVGRVRRAAMRVPEEWSSRLSQGGQNPAYRPSGIFRLRAPVGVRGGIGAERHRKRTKQNYIRTNHDHKVNTICTMLNRNRTP
jgi:hypothetical protein